tara:strand:- start:177 stop:614 length:438 start_codon:yes stop_codon:yes gene_type:complete
VPESLTKKAERLGVARQTLAIWRDDGLDLDDERAVRKRMRERPGEDGNAENSEETKLRKLTAEADILEHKLAVQRGEFVSKESQLAEGMKIGMAVKGVMLRMESDLVPRLAGRKSSEVAKIIREYSRAKLTELSLYESAITIPNE